MTHPRHPGFFRSTARSTPARRSVMTGGIAVAAAAVLAACNVGEPVEEGENGAGAGAGGGAADDTVYRLAHVYEPGHPVEQCGVATLQEELEGSGINVESYPASQLGSEAEVLEQVANGALDMSIAGPSFLGVYHEPAAVLDAAYLFEDVDHFVETVEGDVISGIHDELYETSGIRVLGTWYYGTRHVTSNTPISTPADLAGVKIRTPDAPLYLTNLSAMGGTATPMAFDEVYLALQQGTLDAQENPIPTIDASALYEVQEYINLTGHMIQGVHLVTHDGVYDALTEEQQTALEDALAAASDAVRECIETAEEETLNTWREDGTMQVNDQVNRDEFAQRVQEQLPSQVPWGDIYTEIRES